MVLDNFPKKGLGPEIRYMIYIASSLRRCPTVLNQRQINLFAIVRFLEHYSVIGVYQYIVGTISERSSADQRFEPGTSRVPSLEDNLVPDPYTRIPIFDLIL